MEVPQLTGRDADLLWPGATHAHGYSQERQLRLSNTITYRNALKLKFSEAKYFTASRLLCAAEFKVCTRNVKNSQ